LVEAVEVYFSLQYAVSRLVVRTIVPTVVKSIWIHVVFLSMLKLKAKYPKRKFLIMTQLLTIVTAAGACMQVAAGSVLEAAIMEMVQVCFEVSEYTKLLQGETQLEASSRSLCKALQFLGKRFSPRFVVIHDFLEPRLPKKPPASDDPKYLERREMLAATAACGAVIEAACLTLMFATYLVLPLRPNDVAKEPVSTGTVLQLAAVSFFFEICVSDVLCAYVSSRLAMKDPQRYADITRVWVDIGDFKTVAIMCGIIVSCTMDMMARYLSALCPAGYPSGEEGLMSLGRCPAFHYFSH